MKLNKYINMFIYFPLLGIVVVSLLEASPSVNFENAVTSEFMVVVLICMLLNMVSAISVMIKFILDKLNREKTFVTDFSVEQCQALCRVQRIGARDIGFESEKSDEIILEKRFVGYFTPPGEVGLSFHLEGDRTVIRCKVKGFSAINSIFFCIAGFFLCYVLFSFIGQSLAGTELSQGDYVDWLVVCAWLILICSVLHGRIAGTWKAYRGFFNSRLQATEVVDRKQFIRQFF